MSEYADLVQELAAVKEHHRFDLGQFRKCQDELAAATAEIEQMKGHLDPEHKLWTGTLDDLYKAMRYYESETKRLREALENIKKYMEIVSPRAKHLSTIYAIAQAALDGGKA